MADKNHPASMFDKISKGATLEDIYDMYRGSFSNTDCDVNTYNKTFSIINKEVDKLLDKMDKISLPPLSDRDMDTMDTFVKMLLRMVEY